MFEQEPISLKDKIIRFFVGIFLFVLVGMLIITFLPGDVEQNFMNLLTGQTSTVAGKVGSVSLPMDHFLAARRDCYSRYKEYNPNMAENPEALHSCAFYTLKSLVLSREIGDSVGFFISEKKIKTEVYQEAKFYYSQTATQPGYSAEDLRPISEIYKSLLISSPVRYRQERAVTMNLFEEFLSSQIPSPEGQKELESQIGSLSFNLKVLSFSDIDILNRLESEITVSNEEIAEEYKKETVSGNVPKSTEGVAQSLADRTPILRNKIKLDKKRSKLEEIKTLLPTLKDDPKNSSEISRLVGKPWTASVGTVSDLSSWKYGQETLRLTSDPSFLKDLSRVPFGSGKLSGPYKDGDRTVFVEYSAFTKLAQKTKEPTKDRDRNLYGFYLESIQSIGENYPMQRSKLLEVD